MPSIHALSKVLRRPEARPAPRDALPLVSALLGAALALSALPSAAGPLRDRLEARRAAAMERRDAGDTAAREGLEVEEGGAGTGQANLPAGVHRLADVAYGADPRQRFDVYRPARGEGAPVLVMVHGGAWRLGDKGARGVVENKVAHWVPRGFIFVSVNYRLLPQADPRTQAEDVARALAAVQAQAAGWGGDPAKVVLMGHSAGAHLAALLGAAPQRAARFGVKPWFGTVALDSAVLDVERIMTVRHYRFYDPAFGTDPAYWQATSPITALAAGAPPLLLVCSSTRPDQPCAQAHDFARHAQTLGVWAEVAEQAKSHRQINEELGTPGDYTARVDAFLSSLDAAVAKRLELR